LVLFSLQFIAFSQKTRQISPFRLHVDWWHRANERGRLVFHCLDCSFNKIRV
jgi:hypothetical protein